MKSIASWVVIAALIGGGVYLKMSNKSEANENTKADMLNIIHEMETYPSNAQALDEMCELAHDAAFEEAYSMGGRRSSGNFNAEKYIDGFIDSMLQQAETRQLDQKVKAELEALRHQVTYEAA